MKIKISIFVFLLMSFLNMGAISNLQMTGSPFYNFEITAANKSEFEENGIKLQYRTKEEIKKESLRIKECLNNDIAGDYRVIGKDQVEILNDDFNINIKLWNEDEYTYIEIILINKNSQYTTFDLKNILEKIQNQNSESAQYFLYYKGKIEECYNNQIIHELANENNIKKMYVLDINNGCTGTGYLSNGEKINFALSNYDTGSYIIIGTPIIFATY